MSDASLLIQKTCRHFSVSNGTKVQTNSLKNRQVAMYNLALKSGVHAHEHETVHILTISSKCWVIEVPL